MAEQIEIEEVEKALQEIQNVHVSIMRDAAFKEDNAYSPNPVVVLSDKTLYGDLLTSFKSESESLMFVTAAGPWVDFVR